MDGFMDAAAAVTKDFVCPCDVDKGVSVNADESDAIMLRDCIVEHCHQIEDKRQEVKAMRADLKEMMLAYVLLEYGVGVGVIVMASTANIRRTFGGVMIQWKVTGIEPELAALRGERPEVRAVWRKSSGDSWSEQERWLSDWMTVASLENK